MTNLERELLGALERLESDYNTRQVEWASAFEDLQNMFEITRKNNEKLMDQLALLERRLR